MPTVALSPAGADDGGGLSEDAGLNAAAALSVTPGRTHAQSVVRRSGLWTAQSTPSLVRLPGTDQAPHLRRLHLHGGHGLRGLPARPGLGACVSALLGTLLLAMAASALNEVQEHDKDALMERTRNRPIPRGAVSPLRPPPASRSSWPSAGFSLLLWRPRLDPGPAGPAGPGLVQRLLHAPEARERLRGGARLPHRRPAPCHRLDRRGRARWPIPPSSPWPSCSSSGRCPTSGCWRCCTARATSRPASPPWPGTSGSPRSSASSSPGPAPRSSPAPSCRSSMPSPGLPALVLLALGSLWSAGAVHGAAPGDPAAGAPPESLHGHQPVRPGGDGRRHPGCTADGVKDLSLGGRPGARPAGTLTMAEALSLMA